MSAAVLAAGLAAAATACLLPGGRPRPAPARPKVGSRQSSAHLSAASWAGVGAGLAVLLVAPGFLGLVAAATVGVAVRHKVAGAETRVARRRRLAVEGELPHAVDLLAALLVAGAAPEEALDRVRGVVHPAMAEELGPSVEQLRLGADPLTVWSDLADHPRLGRLGAALRRATLSGAPIAEALTRVGHDLRATSRATTLERVRQVEVRATAPLAVCLLPAFVLLGVVPLVAGTVGRLGLA